MVQTNTARRARPPLWPRPGILRRTEQRQQGPWLSRLRYMLRFMGILALLLVIALSVGYWRLSATVTQYAGPHFNQGRNAVWLEHHWAGTPHKAIEYDQLAQRLHQEQISYVFAHVGPLQSDGTIPTSLAPNADELAAALHQRLPGIRVLAWIGQVEIAGGAPADQSINLADSTVREQIAHTAAHFVTDLGFDGVHYDIEPITNNNPHFLDLLDETRAAMSHGAMLSISAEKWAPNAHAADWLRSQGHGDAWWTSYYYAAVSAHVDQIVAMLYNTAMPTPQLYAIAVKEETTHILAAARSARNPPQVLIGLPTYSGNSFWFHQRAENMESGLTGVIDGLNSNRDTSAFAGVAIYRYALTTDADWTTYNHLWLGQ